jgi:hypothetical protein
MGIGGVRLPKRLDHEACCGLAERGGSSGKEQTRSKLATADRPPACREERVG